MVLSGYRMTTNATMVVTATVTIRDGPGRRPRRSLRPSGLGRPPPLVRADRRLPGDADERARLDGRQRRAATDPAGSALHAGRPRLGDRRVPRRVRRVPADVGPARRPRRPQEG